ncbi:class I SAM-dependent methyltransferase [Aristaeella lactis]|uniref:Methyltransferase domain-containing protein n=1 Tax=Aristaeella lactis TaxID=3046383 RepID=A0AC61PLX2_9FIRM|nr:class I SAM-dependent methyltransferase [Aristaeella lactis]QUA52986.1 class I SAM-dependent methyltransferase [Aristaeella lactis]SMC66463.1 Methyltransferase domain-containing protein [Aristaeella lactis]
MTVSAYGNIPENKQNENEQAVKEPVQEEKMGILGWMNPEDYSFDCMLRMERFQIRYILGNPDEAGKKALAMALKANPKVAGLFMSKCPEMAETVKTLTAQIPAELTPEEIRTAEVQVIGDYEDFVIYTTPNLMPEKCDFIYGWHKERLFEMCPLEGKTVLDVGSGTGRLAFAAAEKAAFVAASEPVDSLREYMRDEIARKGITNMRVCDGMCDSLPFPDNSFDVVMSGHVVGDRFREEVNELTRITKPGGWLLDVPGDQQRETGRNEALIADGWEEMAYEGTFGRTTYRYRKQVNK